MGGGAGYNFSQYVGAMIDVGYNSFGIDSAVLNNLGFPGGGVYHRNQDFTAPTVATITGFDPFFGFYPVNVPTTEILQSYSVTKPGIDAGAGIAFGTKWHGKFFAEARYHRIFIGNLHTDYIPVTFGFRW